MLRCRQAVESAPDARCLVTGLLLLLAMSTLLSVTKEFVELCNLRLAVFTTAFTQTPDLLIAQVIVRGVNLGIVSDPSQNGEHDKTYIAIHILGFLQFLLKLRHGLVVIRTHDGKLRDKDQHRHRQVPKEELLGREGSV